MSTIDRDLLESVEATFHAAGDDAWDVPPTFLVFSHVPARTEDEKGRVVAGVAGEHVARLFNDPVEVIEAIGGTLFHALSNPDAFPNPMSLLRPSQNDLNDSGLSDLDMTSSKIIGAAYVVEMYAMPPAEYTKAIAAMTQDERNAVREMYGRIPITHLTNKPSEQRVLYAVDTKQYIHTLSRVRGEETVRYDQPTQPMEIPGQHQGNRDMIATLVATLDVILQIEATAK